MTNYKNGVRKGVPVDVEHQTDPVFGKRAVGWVKDIYTKTADDGKKALYASIDWTKSGTELLADKAYKFVSPEFYPKGYRDPEAKIGPLNNVMKAITLTNHPLFKGLKSVVASDNENITGLTHRLLAPIIYAEEGEKLVQLEEVRAKEASALSEEEKTFLAEHKADLSAAELTKFGLEAAAPVAPVVDPNAVTTPPVVEATDKSKSVVLASDEQVIKAADLAELKAMAAQGVTANEKLRRSEFTSTITEHVKRGAIKADQLNGWVDTLMAAGEETAKGLATQLEALPSNTVIAAGERGSDEKGTIGGAADALVAAADKIAKDENIPYPEAMKKAVRANEAAAEEYNGATLVVAGKAE